MTSSIFLFLRRLRRPLLVLIATYAICTLGLVLIPGMDAQGNRVHLDFLHAFYIVSYTGSTIGYGELPHVFTAAQRMWMVFTIYVSVTAWLYSIGSIIATLSEPGFRRLIAERRFEAQVRRIGQPFYIVCGYGDTGEVVVRELRRYDHAVVVIEINQSRLDALGLLDLGASIPASCSNAADPARLVAAGLTLPNCIGVLGLTGDDQANLAIAMAGRLLNPAIPAICRSQNADTTANMASFGTRHIVNPFIAFAERMGLTFRAPSAHVVYDCLTSSRRTPAAPPVHLPVGRWVMCGYGRFGKAVREQLLAAGNEVVVIEADPEGTQPPEGFVLGRGTEASTLNEAGIKQAVGIVAGTDHGINNLSIIVTARELQPHVYTIAREVVRAEALLFKNAGLDLRVQLAYLAASEAVELLRNPLLPPFLSRLMQSEENWAAALRERMVEAIGDVPPATWVVSLTPDHAPALCESIAAGAAAPLHLLLRDPRNREQSLHAIALMVRRGARDLLLPDDNFALQPGDQILFCGRAESRRRMHWARHNVDVLGYIATGIERPSGWVWRRKKPAAG